jgi:hypothetical protein
VLFLLKNGTGKALLIAQAASKAEADEYGRAHVPEFSGDCVELEAESRSDAEEFWGVGTVRVPAAGLQTGTTMVKAKVKTKALKPVLTTSVIVVHGLELPEEVVEEDFLTPEDRRDLALDHISRTSEFVGRLEIRKWARG